MNEIMTKVEAPLGETTITLFRRPSDTNEGDLYFTATEGAAALGLCSYRKFLELARAHRDEMIAGEEIVTPSGTIGGKGRDTKLFRISVLDLLGPLTKSEAGKKIRRWTADIRQRFRRGESAEITREYVDRALAAQAKFFTDKLTERDAIVAALTTKLDAQDEIELDLIGYAVATKSVAGRALAEARHLSDPAKQAIKLRKAEAQEKRDRRRGQTYIFTLRRPRPSEMAKVTA